jgi:hypothetical protein
MRILQKLLGSLDLAHANESIRSEVARDAPDVLWIDKGLAISASTLRAVRAQCPNCVIVGYSPDDMMNSGNQSRHFFDGLPEYDVYFTTKSYGVAELKGLGAKSVHFVGNAYDPETHRPVVLSDLERSELGGAVGFIGQWERARAASICALAQADVRVRVWGEDWSKSRCHSPLLRIEGRSLWSGAYAKALCAFDINLCFLRKASRDMQTTRTMEIPACGGFMLAERTAEHLALFDEGKEAEFFSSDEELVEKVRYYISHPEERSAIANAGRQRCLRSGYSNQARMHEMMRIVTEIRK